MAELESCPYCGGNGRLVSYESKESLVLFYYVLCEKCGAMTRPSSIGAELVTALWNRRNRAQGRWEIKKDLRGGTAWCNQCDYAYPMGAPFHEYPPKYCPNCGADMREVNNG